MPTPVKINPPAPNEALEKAKAAKAAAANANSVVALRALVISLAEAIEKLAVK